MLVVGHVLPKRDPQTALFTCLHTLLSFFHASLLLPFSAPVSSQRKSLPHLWFLHESWFCDIKTQVCYFCYYFLGIFNPNWYDWDGYPVLLALQWVGQIRCERLVALTSLPNTEMLWFEDRGELFTSTLNCPMSALVDLGGDRVKWTLWKSQLTAHL